MEGMKVEKMLIHKKNEFVFVYMYTISL